MQSPGVLQSKSFFLFLKKLKFSPSLLTNMCTLRRYLDRVYFHSGHLKFQPSGSVNLLSILGRASNIKLQVLLVKGPCFALNGQINSLFSLEKKGCFVALIIYKLVELDVQDTLRWFPSNLQITMKASLTDGY